jgi:hypothetical protein
MVYGYIRAYILHILIDQLSFQANACLVEFVYFEWVKCD